MLIETRELAEENRRILKSIQLSNRASLALKIVYWVIILGASFGAYYFIQPYVDAIKGSVTGIPAEETSSAAEPFSSLTGAVKNITDLYNQ